MPPRPEIDERAPTPSADEFEDVLRRHVLDVWFPRSLDLEHGGFLCDFDRAWRTCGRNPKLLEFQARQTLVAAEASRAYPDDEGLRRATVHGWTYLRDAMWDRESGGWFHRLDRAGAPLEAGTKHAHGAAYAIEASAAVFEATGEPDALEHAREGLAWLEAHAHDGRHGGYFGFLDRAGRPIRDAAACPWDARDDTIGTPIGLKDANVHSDLLEALLHVHRVRPDPLVAERIEELLEVLSRRLADPATGGLHYLAAADWTPVPRSHRAGAEFQTAYRFAFAHGLFGDGARLRACARGYAEQAMLRARDPRAGGYFLVAAGAPRRSRDAADAPAGRPKSWWVQIEALKAFFALSRLEPEDPRWPRLFASQWAHIRRDYLDARHGGVFPVGLGGHAPWRRRPSLAPAASTRKGDAWKDASHEGRACLYILDALRAPQPTHGEPTSMTSQG